MRILLPDAITEEQMLEDLNGSSSPPFSLMGPWRTHFHFDLRFAETRTAVSDLYTRELRSVVGVWLNARNARERRRQLEKEVNDLRDDHLLARSEWESMGREHMRNFVKLPNGIQGAQLRLKEECERKDDSLFATRVWPSKKRLDRGEKQLSKAKAENRKLDNQILHIISSTLDGVKNVVGHSRDCDDFAVMIVPSNALFAGIVEHVPEPPPKSEIDPTRFSNTSEAISAMVREQFQKLVEAEETEPRSHDREPEGPPFENDDWALRKMAWFAVVQMLTAEGTWKARIAKCADSKCKRPYFYLGKWNTSEKAIFCRPCRQKTKERQSRDRVDNRRVDAENDVLKFVAIRYGDEIQRDPSAWYRNRPLQVRIAQAVTDYIQNSGSAVRTRFRGGVKPRWIVSGNAENKNWLRIQRIAEQMPRSESVDPVSTIKRFRGAGPHFRRGKGNA